MVAIMAGWISFSKTRWILYLGDSPRQVSSFQWSITLVLVPTEVFSLTSLHLHSHSRISYISRRPRARRISKASVLINQITIGCLRSPGAENQDWRRRSLLGIPWTPRWFHPGHYHNHSIGSSLAPYLRTLQTPAKVTVWNWASESLPDHHYLRLHPAFLRFVFYFHPSKEAGGVRCNGSVLRCAGSIPREYVK